MAVFCGQSTIAQTQQDQDNSSLSEGAVDTVSSSLPLQYSGSDSTFVVNSIIIEGNKKTRRSIILRELPFKQGDHYLLQELVKRFEDARRQLMNTALFHEVVVALKSFNGYHIDVLVEVKERWYLFPFPYFKPVDRNLNQWLFEQNASLKRVNYGVKIFYNNATGRNDKLSMWLVNGYTRQLIFSYDRNYIDKRMRVGLKTGVNFGQNKEINYNTVNNKQVFLKTENFLRDFFNVSAEISYRRAINTRHRFGINYNVEQIGDTIVKLNPVYFPSSRNRISFPEFYYSLKYLDFDYNPYPTKGYGAEIFISKKGMDHVIILWSLRTNGTAVWPVSKNSFFTLSGYASVKLPFRQPFYTRQLLGYSDAYLQGYEYYVIDGVAAGIIKTTLTRKLVKFNIKIPGVKQIAPQRVPFSIYGKVYTNAGYVHNPQPGNNSLSNKMLYSAGIGIDMFTIYDFTLKIEWSFNQLGQNGIFLHRKSIL